MKRDDVVLEPTVAATPEDAARIDRQPLYLEPVAGGAARPLFGWLHATAACAASDRVVVICPPVGSEYTRSHRSLRHLADRLAAAGMPALRFDYDGVGDSPGTDLEPDRVAAWRASIATAVHHARRLTGRSRVCLVGVRLGASLAALACEEQKIEDLVLWNACVTGRPYVRELQALAMAAARPSCDIEGAIESAGFVMTAQTLADVRAIDLLASDWLPAGRVLVAGRDDMAPDKRLLEHLAARAIAHEPMRLAGWAGMMAEHQFTVVPDAAIDAIVGWLRQGVKPHFPGGASGERSAPDAIPVGFETLRGQAATVEETLCRFGADRHLFGVLARPIAATDRPAIVVFNAGAAHHVGPNRLYVELTRNLAALGFPCLRFDLESLGDSVNRVPARENYPYPYTAVADGKAALEFLRARFGYRRFVLLGLCSGAHTAFHAGLELEDEAIDELVMINPMQFYWVEGMSLDTSRRFEDMVQYRKSMRDPRRWLKLARGDVNFRRLVEVVGAQAVTRARSYWDALHELAFPDRGPRLSRDLRKIFALHRAFTLFIAEGDPGFDVLMALAKLTATRALKSGRIRLHTIRDADHTFSQWKARREFLERLTKHLDDAALSYKRNGAV